MTNKELQEFLKHFDDKVEVYVKVPDGLVVATATYTVEFDSTMNTKTVDFIVIKAV